MTLEKVLELVGVNNLTIKEYQERQELAAADLSKAKEWWLPELFVGAETFQLWGAAMNADGRFFLDVNAQNMWSGLGLNFLWDIGEGIYNTKAAKLQVLASEYDNQTERNRTVLQSISAYYNLQASQMKFLAYKRLVSQSQTITEQIAVQVDAGLLYQSELLLAKGNHSHLRIELLNAQSEYNQNSAVLVRLLNLESSIKLISMDTMMLPLDFQENFQIIQSEVPYGREFAHKNRPEIKSLDYTLQSLEAEKKKTTTALLLPNLRISTYGSYFGHLNGPVSPMFPEQHPNPIQLYPTAGLNASLMWRIPLGRLVYGGDLKQFNSRINIQVIQSEQMVAQINEEISNANQQLYIGREQIQIAKEALELTSEALEQSIARQEIGTAKPFEVFQAQQFFLQAQVDYFTAVGGYNKAQFAFKVAVGEVL